MLVFSRHPSLHLSSLALPLWAALLREALPHVSGGSMLSPATAAAAVRELSKGGNTFGVWQCCLAYQ